MGEGVENARPIHADIKRNRLAAFKQAIHMLVEKGPFAVIKAHAFPHSIAQHEAGIIDGDFCLMAGHNFAIHINANVPIARVVLCVMGALPVFFHALSSYDG